MYYRAPEENLSETFENQENQDSRDGTHSYHHMGYKYGYPMMMNPFYHQYMNTYPMMYYTYPMMYNMNPMYGTDEMYFNYGHRSDNLEDDLYRQHHRRRPYYPMHYYHPYMHHPHMHYHPHMIHHHYYHPMPYHHMHRNEE